jgi:hypothetical protein
MKPIYLFADSQLLFWKEGSRLFIERFLDDLEADSPTAAYVGAANGDDPQFFDLFQASMEGIGIRDTMMVRSDPSAAEMRFLRAAALVLLAGGDPVRGWRVIAANGVRDAIAERYYQGAVLCGVSAGAIQLGLGKSVAAGESGGSAVSSTFRFVPCVIDVHDDETRWKNLERTLSAGPPTVKGIGIPRGGGVVFRSEDNSIQPIRRPLHELSFADDTITDRLLFPAATSRDASNLHQADEEGQGGSANGRNGQLLQGIPRVGLAEVRRME